MLGGTKLLRYNRSAEIVSAELTARQRSTCRSNELRGLIMAIWLLRHQVSRDRINLLLVKTVKKEVVYKIIMLSGSNGNILRSVNKGRLSIRKKNIARKVNPPSEIAVSRSFSTSDEAKRHRVMRTIVSTLSDTIIYGRHLGDKVTF